MIQREIEKGNFLTSLGLKCRFKYSIRSIHVSQEVLKLNQCLFFVVDVNVQSENVHSVKNYEAK